MFIRERNYGISSSRLSKWASSWESEFRRNQRRYFVTERGVAPHPRRVRHRHAAERGYPSRDACLFFRRSDLRGSLGTKGAWQSGPFRYRWLPHRTAAVVIRKSLTRAPFSLTTRTKMKQERIHQKEWCG